MFLNLRLTTLTKSGILAMKTVVQIESLFKYDEIESLIKSTPNGKSGGIDCVSYEDLKDSCDEYCHVLVNIMNVMLIIDYQVIGKMLLYKEFRKQNSP